MPVLGWPGAIGEDLPPQEVRTQVMFRGGEDGLEASLVEPSQPVRHRLQRRMLLLLAERGPEAACGRAICHTQQRDVGVGEIGDAEADEQW